MRSYKHSGPGGNAVRHRPARYSTLAALLLGLGAWFVTASSTLAAPTLVSASPANGATGISLTSPLVFVFSEAMADITPVPTIAPFFVGNFETTPESLTDALGCDWSADHKTLTCTSSDDLPASTTISWKFNPAGSSVPFVSATGAALATTSGSFTTTTGGGGTGGGAPQLVSSTPASGATGVPVGNAVVFVFDQALVPNPQIGGIPPFAKGGVNWTGTGLTASKFTYTWSANNTTLTCTYSGNLPGNTTITWTLNPSDALFFLQAQDDLKVPETTGSFTTGAGSGGGGDGCEPNPLPDDWGSYSVSKSSDYLQTSPADPTPAASDPFTFSAVVSSPGTGPAATAGSITLPGGSRKDLEGLGFGGMLFYFEQPATSAALETAFPGGTYTLRFTQTGLAERTVTLSMPAANPPVPKVANYAEAQAVTPTANFTLKWNAFTGVIPTDTISLVINDGTNVVFAAPDPCVPRTLANTATEIAIPANTLKTGKIYNATLNFGRFFYQATNAVPKMTGLGALMRQTHFTLNTGSAPAAAAARFVTWQLLPNGHPQMSFEGTAGRVYTIERTPPTFNVPTWTTAGTATPNAAGVGAFEDTAPGALPLIYRAVAR